MEKDFILSEIRRTAELNGGRPLGWRRFLAETGIRETDWLGTHWARWSDAVQEAGFLPNRLQQAYEKNVLLEKLGTLALELGRLPNRGDLRFRAARDPTFPNPKTFSRLGGKRQVVAELADFCRARPAYEDEPLWRYFQPERFVASLHSRTLYFASARQFADPFEGAVAVLPHDTPIDPRYSQLEGTDKAFEELCRLTKISWHRAAYESDAMWKLYAATRKGVAVCTTTQRLRRGLLPFRLAPHYGEEEPFWGSVRYVDLHRERLRVNMERRFSYKHRAFEWEREFRIAISVRMAEEFGVAVPQEGIEVGFDPAVLIEAVYLGPALSEAERTSLRETCVQAGLKCQFVTSTLLGQPRYV
jgi:hypothetical protein